MTKRLKACLHRQHERTGMRRFKQRLKIERQQRSRIMALYARFEALVESGELDPENAKLYRILIDTVAKWKKRRA